MKFHVGIGSEGKGFFGSTSAAPVLWGDRDERGRADWALMKLKTCVGSPSFNVGWFDVTRLTSDQLLGAFVVAIGFAASTERGALSISAGKIEGLDRNNGLLKSSASMDYGQSGGGLFQYTDRTVLVCMAVKMLLDLHNPTNKYADGYTPDRANEFINVSEIAYRPDIRATLEADKARVGYVNAAANRLTRPLPIATN